MCLKVKIYRGLRHCIMVEIQPIEIIYVFSGIPLAFPLHYYWT